MAKFVPLNQLPEWRALCHRYRYNIELFAFEALGIDYTLQQKQLFLSVAQDGSRTSVSSGHGCFAKGTMIRLYDGSSIAVEDVTIDHYLMGDDGKSSREVIYLQRGREEMYKFTYGDGRSHTFNKSHILCLQHIYTGEKREVLVSTFLNYNAVDRAMWGSYRLEGEEYAVYPIHQIENLGEDDYFGFLVDGNNKFLAEDGTVLHNTGKTRSAGIVALWHLLFFENSIMMFTAPQIQQLRKHVWREIESCKAMLERGRLKWLSDYVIVLAETVYIKGAQKTWQIYAKTAPKGNPQALAGNHADNLFIWVDEAAAVEDGVFDVCVGALTHENNRMCLTSQPARQAGFFYDTHHKLARRNGGIWTSMIFNSEMTPLVSKSKIYEALLQYGSRDDPQYMIRIRGEFPDLAGEFIITQKDADYAYKGFALGKKDHSDYGYFILCDVGGGVGRDDSVIAVAKVWGSNQWGKNARRAEIVKIPLCRNDDNIHMLIATIEQCLLEYPNALLLLDKNGAGLGLSQELTSLGIYYKPINWGGQCFSNKSRKEFVNKRAQAYVCLARAIKQGRFKVKTAVQRAKILGQMTRIPYSFDDQARFRMLGKKEMQTKNIKSPDVADCFAFIFLEGIAYTPALEDEHGPDSYNHGDTEQIKTPKDESMNEADELADLME